MSTKDIEAYWNELNEMYGGNIEMPNDLVADVTNFDMDNVRHDLAMGRTFDSAMQEGMR